MGDLVVTQRATAQRATELEKLSHIRLELAEASTLPEINKIIQQAQATREDALRASRALKALGYVETVIQETLEIAREAGAINLDAQAKAGGILREMAEEGLRRGPGNPQFTHAEQNRPGAEELGLDRNDVARWQQVERVDPDIRQQYIEEAKAKGGDITRGGLIDFAERAGQNVQPAEKTAIHKRAEEVIGKLLANGPMESKAFQKALEQAGISQHALNLVQKSMNVIAEHAGAGVVWKIAEPEDIIPRMGPHNRGYECPGCGGYGWVEHRPIVRNPRGFERVRRMEKERERRAGEANGG